MLGLAIADHLYRRFPERPEGELAKLRAQAVSRASCTVVAAELDLASYLRARAGELGFDDVEPVIDSPSVLGAAVEAAIGAAFIEFGLEAVAPAVVDAFSERIEYALDRHVDHKTVLQEELARRGASVTYLLTDTSGPPHQRRFTTAAVVGEHEVGAGSGPTKKSSEQAAAREALANLERLT